MGTLFETQRTRLIKQYKTASQPFTATTKPYKSTLQLTWDIVGVQGSAPSQTAYAVARQGQILEFFGYGINESIPWGRKGATRKATESDTNLSKGRQTNGVEDMVIEGVSSSARSMRIDYGLENAIAQQIADVDVRSMYAGQTVSLDPAALVFPPQCMSPFNLEQVFFEAVKPHLAIEFEWDRRHVEKIGTLDEIPEGGAKSYLRASGDPRIDNRYRVPEGYLWRRAGEPDGEFIMRASLAEPVVIPIQLVSPPLAGVTTPPVPQFLFLDITMRLHGMTAAIPTKN